MENEPVTVYRAAQIFRKFLFNYRDQLHASIIIAGCDDKKGGQVFIYKKFHKCSTKQIYSIPLGGFTTRQYFTASGSGGAYLNTFIDRNWKPGMTRDQVFQVRFVVSINNYNSKFIKTSIIFLLFSSFVKPCFWLFTEIVAQAE